MAAVSAAVLTHMHFPLGHSRPGRRGADRQESAFRDAYHALQRRIQLFLCLPLDSIDEMSLQTKLREIGRTRGEDSA